MTDAEALQEVTDLVADPPAAIAAAAPALARVLVLATASVANTITMHQVLAENEQLRSQLKAQEV